jgi:hypothetical protein
MLKTVRDILWVKWDEEDLAIIAHNDKLLDIVEGVNDDGEPFARVKILDVSASQIVQYRGIKTKEDLETLKVEIETDVR